MDIICPYKHSRWSGIELKYALRSAVKYLTGIGNVYIIGDKPDWIKNIIHIHATDEINPVWKEKNVYKKLLIACNDERISDDFIYINDDHFLMDGFDIRNNYACIWGDKRNDSYQQTIDNTINETGASYNFDTHCPCIFNKKKFIELMSLVDWDVKYGYCMKTIYAYYRSLLPKIVTDLKITDESLTRFDIFEQVKGRWFFSIGENMRTGPMLDVLNSLYREKTIYEI